MQVMATHVLHVVFCIFFFFLHFSLSHRDQSRGTTFEVYMEQSSDDHEGTICEHFLSFSEHIICQYFLVVLR